ncbi:hypothetical protein [Salipaludibacillus sp. LMS25]|uniref:hypothetical protein n=1 Tax=Salipaludibacillus sp. LMS25 TaxID=2924031 RepID=UPI0034E9751F
MVKRHRLRLYDHPSWCFTNDKGTGKIKTHRESEIRDGPQENVANVTSLENDATIGKAFQVVTGDVPISGVVNT